MFRVCSRVGGKCGVRKLHLSLDIETHWLILKNPKGKSNQTAYISSTSDNGVDLGVSVWIHFIVGFMVSCIGDLGFEIGLF